MTVRAVVCIAMLQASPEFKGIKTDDVAQFRKILLLQASPEFKRIKTDDVAQFRKILLLQASPEFKGIKTWDELCFAGTSQASSQP